MHGLGMDARDMSCNMLAHECGLAVVASYILVEFICAKAVRCTCG